MEMEFLWESNEICSMGWDGTARNAFPNGRMEQKLMSRKLKIC